jgi:hypothetical protein
LFLRGNDFIDQSAEPAFGRAGPKFAPSWPRLNQRARQGEIGR